MITRRVDRKRKTPLPKTTNLLLHQLRKKELARIHGIRETDIFVDPKNGVELFRTEAGTWATSPGY